MLPKEIRELDGLRPGQVFEVERIDEGEYRLVRQSPHPNEGVVDGLLSCPERDFFRPVESSATDGRREGGHEIALLI